MRLLSRTSFLLLLLLAALVARQHSTGRRILMTGRDYLDHLESGHAEKAHDLLSDSLASLIGPEQMEPLLGAVHGARMRTGRMEQRGLPVSASSDIEGSRTLWLQRSKEGTWRVAGDTSLDNILGSSTLICASFARREVIPRIASGESPRSFSCPVSGSPYFVEDGMLRCSAGHLDGGIGIGGAACATLRDSLAAAIVEYVSAGRDRPHSFREMFDRTGGEFGRRGGFRCPDDGYSYMEIRSEGVHCPFHGLTSPFPDAVPQGPDGE